MGEKAQMKNKTERQLKKEYSLPQDGKYNYTTDYKGSMDKQVKIGRTGKNEWGAGGNTQVKIKPGQGKVECSDFYPGSTSVKK